MQDTRGIKWIVRDISLEYDSPNFENFFPFGEKNFQNQNFQNEFTKLVFKKFHPENSHGNFRDDELVHKILPLPFYTEPMWPRKKIKRVTDLLYFFCAQCGNDLGKTALARVVLELFMVSEKAHPMLIWRTRLVCNACQSSLKCSYTPHIVSVDDALQKEMKRGWDIFVRSEQNSKNECKVCGRKKKNCENLQCEKIQKSDLWKKFSYEKNTRFMMMCACFKRIKINLCTPLARRNPNCFRVNCEQRHAGNLFCLNDCCRVFYCSPQCRDIAALGTHKNGTCEKFTHIWNWG